MKLLHVCMTCAKAGLLCSPVNTRKDAAAPNKSLRGHATSRLFSSSARVLPTSPNPSLSPSSSGALLSAQQLSYSLVFHLVTLHIKHRPPIIDVGLSTIAWNQFGDDIARVAGRTAELSVHEQGMAWLSV